MSRLQSATHWIDSGAKAVGHSSAGGLSKKRDGIDCRPFSQSNSDRTMVLAVADDSIQRSTFPRRELRPVVQQSRAGRL